MTWLNTAPTPYKAKAVLASRESRKEGSTDFSYNLSMLKFSFAFDDMFISASSHILLFILNVSLDHIVNAFE